MNLRNGFVTKKVLRTPKGNLKDLTQKIVQVVTLICSVTHQMGAYKERHLIKGEGYLFNGVKSLFIVSV